ncbi:hypothetical protein BDN72DRAFT_779451, partial [Pluteus cervinus]
DGQVGALVREGQSFVTSPNTRRICNPPFGGDRSVYLRSNVRYGQDDPLQWPQPLRRDTLYLSAVPIVPRSAAQHHPLSIMYWNPDQREFDEDRTSLISGIGRINPSYINGIHTLCTTLFERADEFAKKDSTPTSALSLLSEFIPLLHRYLYRAQHLPTTFMDASFGVRSVQRLYLMITALLDWHLVFLPKLHQNSTGAAVVVASVMGAFTTSVEVGDELYRMGVPVWFIRPTSEIPNARIQALKTLIEPSILPLHPHRYKNYTIFNGPSTDPGFLRSLVNELHRHLNYPNPFGVDVAPRDLIAPPMLNNSSSSFPSPSPFLSPSPLPSPSPSALSFTSASAFSSASSSSSKSTIRQEASHPKYTSTQGSGRDKFTDPQPPAGVPRILPPLLPIWQTALMRANRRGAGNVSHKFDAINLSYIFPEPASLQAVEKADRLEAILHMWLRCRPVFIFRLTAANSDATPMSARSWKDFLSLDYLAPVETHSKSQTRIGKARDFLQSCIDQDGISIAPNTFTPSWRGRSFNELTTDHLKEIIWEMNELNFRFEFMALDSHLSSDLGELLHNRLLESCFPACSLGSLLVADIDKANAGIASFVLTQRGEALQSFRRVLNKWTLDGVVKPPLINSLNPLRHDKATLDLLELQIAMFYVECFCVIFHRAPVLPRRLEHIPQTILPPPHGRVIMNPRPNVYYDLSVLDLSG